MAFTTRDQLVAGIAAGPVIPVYKASITAVAANVYSLFRTAAGMPSASTIAVPTTTGRTLDRTSSGAIPIPAVGANTLYWDAADITGTVAGTVVFFDRLVEFGGLSGITTGAQSLSAVSLPARAGTGVGCELWLDWYVATGATPSPTVTCSYTNQAGTSGRVATLMGGIVASVPANRCYPMALDVGDTGVQSVQSFSSGLSTATAGSIGVTIRKRIGSMPMSLVNVSAYKGWAETGLSIIPTDACVEMLVVATTTSTGVIQGTFSVAQG